MEAIIYTYAPEYWNRNQAHQAMCRIELTTESDEYKQIYYEVQVAVGRNNVKIANIERYQNVYDLGQFLVRGQLLIHLNTSRTYYRVRRFIAIYKNDLNLALEYNIDPRRCKLLYSLKFSKSLPSITSDQVILVVQVLTDNIYSDIITPENSSNYFIDYIITLS